MTYLDKFVFKCHNTLVHKNTPEVQEARDYLSERKVNSHSISCHKIGYCPFDVDIPVEIKEYGKDVQSKREIDYSYFIQGKLIVPIFSEFGEIEGFATRPPSFNEGSYWWNLPFKKGNHLFLLDKARKHIFNSNKIFIVEGYMDAILLWQKGLKEVVGLMGTALTLRKIGLIARYCNNVCLSFDCDENQAGQKAKNKSICILHKFNFCENMSAIDLPMGEDPASFIGKNELKEFLQLEKSLSIPDIKKVCKELSK